ncbi:MAG: nucleotidyltransferase domain-containing protein [Lachnospiraceae bacterium]|nr:nucleotidyltransferase domain-containing protein [Lachnospiraceae bacterium]
MQHQTITKVEDIVFQYPHHREAVKELISIFREKEGVIALVFGGSVAKHMEREDSDIDAMVIVTEEFYERKRKVNCIAECISMEDCAYPGGYFDVKYMTKDYIRDAAEKGSEPTRNSFIGSHVLFSADEEVTELVRRIPVFQKQEFEEKMLSFFSNLQLNYNYFWKACRPEGYMKLKVASEIVYSLYRMVLQENEILFPCNRRLEQFVKLAPDQPEHLVEYCEEFCRTLEDDPLDKALEAWKAWTHYQYPTDSAVCQSRYCDDFEQWWRVPRPLVSEW